MLRFDDLPDADKTGLIEAAAARGKSVKDVYTSPRPASEWERRARIAANLLGNTTDLVDIGCGSMTIRRMLPPDVRYLGVDIVARAPDTLVINLNEQPLPDLAFGSATALGVMEYLYDPAVFLRGLRQFDRVIFSYCTRTIRLSRKARLRRHWVNHLDRSELEALLKDSGFDLAARQRLSFSEWLYDLR